MPFIKTTPPGEARDAVLEMYQRQQLSWGYVPDYAKVFCHRPETMARWGRLLAEIKRPMDAQRFELVTFVAALELRNTACALAHGNKLREFLPDEDILALAEGKSGPSISGTDQAIIRFARQIARDASRVTSGDVDQLKKQGLSDEDIFDIVATVAGRAFFTKMLDALGVESDSSFLNLDETFRRPLTVGRPIGFRKVETLPAS